MGFVAEAEDSKGTPALPQELGEALQALRASQERERLLRNELAHGVRNIFAVTRSIFVRTRDASPTQEHLANHFLGRLDTLARYQGRSVNFPVSGFDLEDMILAELLVYAVVEDPRIEVAGPPVSLAHRSGEVMGIALHELVTNAIKFGALAQPGGSSRLRISWTVADDALDFEWSERGVPIVAPAPRPEGFGQEYIERVLPYQLDATSSFEVAPGGLTCRIHLPLHQGAGVADPYGQ